MNITNQLKQYYELKYQKNKKSLKAESKTGA